MDSRSLAGRLADVQVIDVRDQNEWEAGRIDGALHIPGDDLAERAGELARDRPIVTVCRSGARSEAAAEWLRGEGFEAENLDGGMQAWAEAGLPYQAADGAPGTVAEAEPPPDDRPPELQELQAGFLEVVFAAQEHFGGRQPSDEEMQSFLRQRLLADGKTPAEADQFLARMGENG